MLRTFLAFAASSAVLAIMIWAEICTTGSHRYFFLLWNVILAWIPYLLSLAMSAVSKWRIPVFLLGLAWFFFFPNAPYMLTDIVNLNWPVFYETRHHPYERIHFWYPFTYFMIAVTLSFLMGVQSLRSVQDLVARAFGNVTGWLFAISMLGLSGYGIFLGRFVRLNSWDVLARPDKLLATVLQARSHETLILSGLFALLLICAYLPASMMIQNGQKETL